MVSGWFRVEVSNREIAQPISFICSGTFNRILMCLKWFNIVNHFLTALYGKWDSESHSHINDIGCAISLFDTSTLRRDEYGDSSNSDYIMLTVIVILWYNKRS